MTRTTRRRRRPRRGAAAVELALLLPMLAFVCMATIDFARAFYSYTILAECARNGAIYASDPNFATSTTYTSYTQAAQADAISPNNNLTAAPTITYASGTDGGGNNYVQVSASYTFQTIANYPGIPTSIAMSRSIRMVVTPP